MSSPRWRAACRAVRLLAATSATAVVAASFGDARATEPMRLRVLTFNAFGVAPIAPHTDERMEAIPAAIFALTPDVVLVQELWRTRDAELFTQRFRAEGFVETRAYGAPHLYDEGKGGLFVASRFPFEEDRFTAFVDGTYPHIPYHLDWRGGKGFFAARVRTPVGPIGVLNAHMQASYETGNYEATRIAQIVQLSEGLRTGASAGILRAEDPLLVGGDLNALPDDPSMRLLELATGVRIGESFVATDLIAARNGARLRLVPQRSTRVLLEPLRLPDGASVPLSDHEGLLVEYLVGESIAPGAPSREVDRDAVLAAVRAELAAETSRTRWLSWATAAGAVASLFLAARTARWVRTRAKRRDRIAGLAFALWCTFWCAWWAYTSLVFAPHQLAMVRRVEGALADFSP